MLYNKIEKIYSLLYRLFIYPYYKLYFAQFGSQSKIGNPIRIEYPGRIYIGSNVLIRKNAWLAANPLTGNDKCKLVIGDGTYIGHFAHFYCTSKIEIGNKVLIADRVYISDNSHGYKNINLPIIDQPITQLEEVIIGYGAWLGENVCVVGASVGEHSIVGANSVVTKSIPDYCIAVGSPAKIIKRYNFEIKDWQKTNDVGEFI